MAARILSKDIIAWRIGDPGGRFPIFSGDGAALAEGRWHKKGEEVIYTSEHYSTAMLEKLVHYNGILPPDQHFIKITIPSGTTYEIVTKDSLPGWDKKDGSKSRDYGSQWLNEGRSSILIVPSIVAREENNILINPKHRNTDTIDPGIETPIRWDERLFPG